MAYTEAQKRATMEYMKKNLEEVRFRVKKGERAALQAEAEENGLSMSQYIVQAVNDKAGRQILTPSSSGDGGKK